MFLPSRAETSADCQHEQVDGAVCAVCRRQQGAVCSLRKKKICFFFFSSGRQAGGRVDAGRRRSGRRMRSAENHRALNAVCRKKIKIFSFFFFHAIDAVWTLLEVIGLMYFRSGQADVLDAGTTRKLTSKLISKCERIAAR